MKKKQICIGVTKKQWNILNLLAEVEGFTKLTDFVRYLIVDYIMNNLDRARRLEKQIKMLEREFNLDEFLHNFIRERDVIDDYKLEVNVNELDYLVNLKRKEEKDKLTEQIREMMQEINDLELLGIDEDEEVESDGGNVG